MTLGDSNLAVKALPNGPILIDLTVDDDDQDVEMLIVSSSPATTAFDPPSRSRILFITLPPIPEFLFHAKVVLISSTCFRILFEAAI